MRAGCTSRERRRALRGVDGWGRRSPPRCDRAGGFSVEVGRRDVPLLADVDVSGRGVPVLAGVVPVLARAVPVLAGVVPVLARAVAVLAGAVD
jgi:hypothetical protein